MDEFVGTMIACAILASCLFGGCVTGRKEIKDWAVEAGSGEYFINEHNAKAFRWKTNLTAKP